MGIPFLYRAELERTGGIKDEDEVEVKVRVKMTVKVKVTKEYVY